MKLYTRTDQQVVLEPTSPLVLPVKIKQISQERLSGATRYRSIQKHIWSSGTTNPMDQDFLKKSSHPSASTLGITS